MTSGKWNEKEIIYLRNNYPNLNIDISDICNYLNRNYSAVILKASRLKIIRNSDATQEEKEFLKENYVNKTNKELSEILGRSLSFIESVAGVLKLRKDKFFWSKEEVEILKENYLTQKKDIILNLIPNKNWQSIVSKANTIKIKRTEFKNSKLWEQDEVELLKKLYPKTKNIEIAKILNRSVGKISSKASKLKLKKRDYFINKNDYEKIKNLSNEGVPLKIAISQVGTEFSFSGILKKLNKDSTYIKRKSWENESDTTILSLLKKVSDILGYAPMVSDLVYLGLPNGAVFVKRFNSYSNACKTIGYNKSNLYGTICFSKNNDKCLSLKEKIITDFLIDNNIGYEKEFLYSKIINVSTNERCDWKLFDDTFVEYFGISGKKEYDKRSEKKINLCKENKIELIKIYPKDISIKKLENIFSKYIN